MSVVTTMPGVLARARAAISPLPRLRDVLAWSAAVFGAQLALHYFSLRVPPLAVSAIWLPAGLILGALLASPYPRWPAIVAGGYVGTLANFIDFGLPAVHAAALAAIVIAALAGCAAAIRRLAPDPLMRDLRSTIVFIALGPLSSALVVQGAWLALASLTGWPHVIGPSWQIVRLSGGLGMLTLTPVVTWAIGRGRSTLRETPPRRWAEAAALAAAAATLALVLPVIDPRTPVLVPVVLYGPLPLLLWSAFRFGPAGASVSLLIVGSTLAWQARAGRGEFGALPPLEALMALQVVLAVLAIPTLLFAAIMQERQAGLRNLRSRDDLLRTTINSLPSHVTVLDRDGVVRYASEGWTAYARWVLDDPHVSGLGLRYLDVCARAKRIGPDTPQAWTLIRSVLDGTYGRATMEYQCYLNEECETPSWLLLQVAALPATRGGAVVCLTDLTDLRDAETALRENEHRLKRAMEAGRVGEWEANLRTGAVWWSDRLNQMAGLPPGSIDTHEKVMGVLHPDDRALMQTIQSAFLEVGDHREGEFRIRRPDGTYTWVESRGEVVSDSLVVGVTVDVTPRKRAEEALRSALADVQRLRDQLSAENEYLHQELSAVEHVGDPVYRSQGMRAVLAQTEQVAPTLTPVLITGETGTGKEVLARMLHGLSGRKDRSLVRVNCAALPVTLIESELFGHERGAFTGANSRRVGRFELADGGTLFLDEIGELPLELQPKLLRVLQENEFERVGGSRTISVSVRILAATNRDLAECVRAGTFRADLYYRLSVFPIRVPPLRERVEDIGALTKVFLERANARLRRECDGVPRDVLTQLEGYAWPGNVRELQNMIERAVLLSRGKFLRLPDGWDASAVDAPAAAAAPVAAGLVNPIDAGPLLPLEEVERQYITRVLNNTRWRVEGPYGAAVVLGMNPSTLRSRMSKLGILSAARRRQLPPGPPPPGNGLHAK
jgi:PAS domain S-box-containing protein